MAWVTLKNFMVAGATTLFVLVGVAAFESPGGAWPLCVAAIALLVMAHVDRIVEISASATGAKIVLQQVQDKVVELKRLVVISGKMHMAIAQRMGRWGSPFTHAEMEAIRDESESLMRDAGVPESQISSIRATEWDRYVHLDYVFWIVDGVVIRGRGDRDLTDIRKPGTPDEVDSLLSKLDAMTEERKKRLDMYRHFVTHGRHLDPSAWANRHPV